jgi:basic membrane protein A
MDTTLRQEAETMRTTRKRLFVAPLVALALLAAACGDDDDDDDGGATADATTTAAAAGDQPTTTAAGAGGEATTTAAGAGGATSENAEGRLLENQPDVNGDGDIVIGLAVGGDSNDGGFYESVKNFGQEFVDEQDGWELIVVDQIAPADYVQEMSNLARQGVDMLIAIGGVSPYDAMVEVSGMSEFADLAFVMLAGTAQEVPTENFITVRDDVFEVNYITGVAAALLMNREGDTTAGFVSGPEVDFSVAARAAFEAGLKSQIPDAEVVFTYTGSMDDAALAVEAARSQISNDAGLIYPYLGGATNGVAQEANDQDVPVLASSVNRCEDPSYEFAGAGLFSKAPYLIPILEDFRDGEFRTGFIRTFHVTPDRRDLGPGTLICDATAEEDAILDDVAAQIADGTINPRDAAAQFM